MDRVAGTEEGIWISNWLPGAEFGFHLNCRCPSAVFSTIAGSMPGRHFI
jgi:hypothetical protein